MRAVQVMAPGQVEFIETPVPEPAPGNVLVRTSHVSLCGSDVWMIHYAPKQFYPFPPGTTGHEVVGQVEKVNDPNSSLRPGDWVLALVIGHRGMAEFCELPAENALPLPPGKPVEHLLQAQQLGTIIYACKFLPHPVLNKNVAVIGQGSAGLWWDWMLRRMGARRVIGIDLQPHRLMLPTQYGATHTVNNSEVDPVAAVREITGEEGVDLVVEAAGEQSSVKLTYELLKTHGDILFFGIPHFDQLDLDYPALFRRYPNIKMISGALNDPKQGVTWQALEYIASGEIDVAPVITHRFSFDQVMEAYELQRTRDEGSVKILVEMQK